MNHSEYNLLMNFFLFINEDFALLSIELPDKISKTLSLTLSVAVLLPTPKAPVLFNKDNYK